MNVEKFKQLIEAVKNDEVLSFRYNVIRDGNCGCPLGTAAKLFWGLTNDVRPGSIENATTPYLGGAYFNRIREELEINEVEADILFNNAVEESDDDEGSLILVDVGTGSMEYVAECTKEEWLNRAEEFLLLKTQDEREGVKV